MPRRRLMIRKRRTVRRIRNGVTGKRGTRRRRQTVVETGVLIGVHLVIGVHQGVSSHRDVPSLWREDHFSIGCGAEGQGLLTLKHGPFGSLGRGWRIPLCGIHRPRIRGYTRRERVRLVDKKGSL